MKALPLSRDTSVHTAVLVRVVAFFVSIVSIVLIPSELAAAAAGHADVTHAFVTSGVAAALTIVTAVAARSLDPLRR